jgi:transposase
MSNLSESQRGEIIGLYKNNVPNSKISKILDVHRTTVSRTIKKYLDGKNLTSEPRSGRPKSINKEG